jgi:pyruvate ferredoxin oxidoreductase alpha subunit
MTATSSQGLALMWEVLYITASNRCPVVMSLVSRALSAPANIHCDHADVMGMRDSGWIILLSENGQEAYDNLLQAVCIGEHPDVLLPVVVCQDGFITSHGVEKVEVYDELEVKALVGEYHPRWPLLDLEKPKTYGPVSFHQHYYEHKRQQIDAMQNARQVILEVAGKFNARFNRHYGLFDAYHLEDADVAVVVANSTAGTARVVVDQLREDGVKVGLLKPRVFRPFPDKELADALRTVKAVAVLDRSASFGSMDSAGPLFLELVAALAVHDVRIPVMDYVYGIGGRDILPHEIEAVFRETLRAGEAGQAERTVTYLGVRE